MVTRTAKFISVFPHLAYADISRITITVKPLPDEFWRFHFGERRIRKWIGVRLYTEPIVSRCETVVCNMTVPCQYNNNSSPYNADMHRRKKKGNKHHTLQYYCKYTSLNDRNNQVSRSTCRANEKCSFSATNGSHIWIVRYYTTKLKTESVDQNAASCIP